MNVVPAWVKTLVKADRYLHIQGVVEASTMLADQHGLTIEKVALAAWLHDCAKELTREKMLWWIGKGPFHLDRVERQMPGLWHPHAGASMAYHHWKIRDRSILEAIRCHTLGQADMGTIAQAVFVGDFIEKGRRFIGLNKARKAAAQGLREGVLCKASMTMVFLTNKKMRIHPRLVETWNGFLAQDKK